MENKERKETIKKFARVNISKLWEKRTLRTFHTFFYLRSKEGILQSIFLQIFKGLHSMNRYRVIGVMNTIKHYIIEKTRLCNVL